MRCSLTSVRIVKGNLACDRRHVGISPHIETVRILEHGVFENAYPIAVSKSGKFTEPDISQFWNAPCDVA